MLVCLLAAVLAPGLAPSGGARAAADPITPTNGLKLTITSMSPREVSANNTNVAVQGTVTNISDRVITEVKARLQLGDAVTSDKQLSDAEAGAAPTDAATTAYQTVTSTLQPGQTASLSLTAQLQGTGSLDISKAGVYPLMVNLQGSPAYGGQARLAAASLLLPVTSVPGAVPPAGADRNRLTLLWPLVDDQPRVIGVAGNGQEVLADDSLADSLVPGGRLFGLVQSVKDVSVQNPALLSAMCFAIDPDLLATVHGMAGGYQVQTATGTRAGAGATAAAEWLNMLSKLTAGNCVLSLPEADADLVALSRAGATNLAKLALDDSTEISSVLPGTTPLSGVAWPSDGALDDGSALALAGMGVNTELLQPDAVAGAATGSVSLQGLPANRSHAVLIDQAVSGALAEQSANPSNVDVSGVSAQNGIAALTYRTLFAPGSGQTELIAPPRRWNSAQNELESYLDVVGGTLSAGGATPVGLATLAAAAPSGPSVRLTYPAAAAAAEIPASVTGRVVTDDAAQQDMLAAMNRDHANPVTTPTQLIGPLRVGLLRAVSGAWRTNHQGAAVQLSTVEQEFSSVRGAVSVVATNQTFSLGSQSSRLPVAVTNSLPVDIVVQVDLAGQSGLAASAVRQTILAGGSTTLYLPVKISRSGRFSVEVSVTTPGGTQLGHSARFEVVSGAYGTIILVITVAAFAILVLLSIRRIYRRLRSSREATPDEQDLPTLPGEPTVPNVPTVPSTAVDTQEPVEH